jgi:hypothetical protein
MQPSQALFESGKKTAGETDQPQVVLKSSDQQAVRA